MSGDILMVTTGVGMGVLLASSGAKDAAKHLKNYSIQNFCSAEFEKLKFTPPTIL